MKSKLPILRLTSLTAILVLHAHAANRSWTGATNTDWGTSTNWSPTGTPISSDTLLFDASSTANRNTTLGATSYTINGITNASALPGDVSISSTGGVLTFNGSGIAWWNGSTRNLSISAPVVVTGAAEAWWVDPGTTVALSGTVALNTDIYFRGNTTSSGAVTSGTFSFSNNVTVASGKVIQIGDNGYDGKVEITAGVFDSTASSVWLIGQNSANSNGSLTISGSGQFKYSTSNILYVGNAAGTGTVTVSGSGILEASTSSQTIVVGRAGGTGTLNLDGGTLLTSRSIRGSDSGAGTGTVNFNGGTLKAKDGDNANWLLSASTFNAYVRGGAIIDTNGYNMGTSVALQHDAGGPAVDGGLTKNGTGTLTLGGASTYTGGTIVNAGTLTVGSGGTLGAGTGTLAVNNPNTGAGTAVVLNLATGANTTVGSLNGTLATPSGGTNSATINTQSGRTFTVNQTSSGTYSGVIAGAGDVTLGSSSTNTLTLTNTNTYTGATTINAGKLVVNGSISTSTLTTVNSGGTLGGSGTVGALTVLGTGVVAPGNSPGVLNTGNYTQTAGTLTLELNGTTPGTNYDQLNVVGTVTLGGALTGTITGYTPVNGDLLFILANDSSDTITTTFSGMADLSTITLGGRDWQISYNANFTGVGPTYGTFLGGNDIALLAVPEPNVAALLGGVGMLALLRRRRR